MPDAIVILVLIVVVGLVVVDEAILVAKRLDPDHNGIRHATTIETGAQIAGSQTGNTVPFGWAAFVGPRR